MCNLVEALCVARDVCGIGHTRVHLSRYTTRCHEPPRLPWAPAGSTCHTWIASPTHMWQCGNKRVDGSKRPNQGASSYDKLLFASLNIACRKTTVDRCKGVTLMELTTSGNHNCVRRAPRQASMSMRVLMSLSSSCALSSLLLLLLVR